MNLQSPRNHRDRIAHNPSESDKCTRTALWDEKENVPSRLEGGARLQKSPFTTYNRLQSIIHLLIDPSNRVIDREIQVGKMRASPEKFAYVLP